MQSGREIVRFSFIRLTKRSEEWYTVRRGEIVEMSEYEREKLKLASAFLGRRVMEFDGIGGKFSSFWCRVAFGDEDVNYSEHAHSFFEFHCCLQGEIEIASKEKKFLLRAGDVFCASPVTTHKNVRRSVDSAALVWGVEAGNPSNIKGSAAFSRPASKMERLATETLLEKAIAGGTNAARECQSILSFLFYSFTEEWGTADDTAGKKTDVFSSVDRYVRDNAETIENVEEVARQFYVSVRHLSRICRLKTGLPFGRYLRERKMERAKELLEEHSVKETAEMLGYSDESSFSRAFLNVIGDYPAKCKKYRF